MLRSKCSSLHYWGIFGGARAERANSSQGRMKAHSVIVTKKSLKNDVATGDVVTLHHHSSLMTVEAIRSETFGVVLDCVWFDSDDSLRFKRVPLNKADIFPLTEAPANIMRGMEIRLRSRGPVMTVRELRIRDGVEYADCVWTGPMDRERCRMFPTSALVLTMMERFEGALGESI